MKQYLFLFFLKNYKLNKTNGNISVILISAIFFAIHSAVFLLFFSYSLLHASRKTFSNVKVSISKQWTPSAFNKSVEPAEVRIKCWNGFQKGTVFTS